MKISVIVPVYNEEENIGRTIDSLLDQAYDDYEIIAVNDASTDNSIDVLNKYRKKRKSFDSFWGALPRDPRDGKSGRQKSK